jgi:hypothetical protein
MNRWKFHRNTSRLILALASLLTLIIIVITGVSSYAVTPDTAFAYIVKFQGNGLTLGTGDIRNRQPVSLKDKLEGNKVLYIPGGNKPWAHLGFAVDYPKDFAQLIVKAGPHPDVSEWSFPCTAKGGLTIAWKRGDEKACKDGVKLQSSSKKSGLPNNNLQASRRLLAQAEDEVTVVPTPGESTIQTADSAAGITIDVLIGDVQVKSAKNPGGRLVKAGERYDYPQDTITPIDINPILNSPEMQDFLNPNNWLSPDISQRVADGIAGQLGEMQRAVSQLPKQPVASNPETPVSQPLTPSSPKTPTTQSQTTLTQSPPGKGRCGEQQVSGGQAGDVRKIQLSRASGKIYIAYDMCPVPDTIIVEYESKKLLQKTVSGRGLDQVEIQGISTELTVEVIGNPNTNTTRWGYILSCPDDDKAPEPPSSVCSDSKEPSILDPLKDLIRNRLPIPLPF